MSLILHHQNLWYLLTHTRTLQLTVTQAEIISAAQRGDINAIRELLESGKSKVTDRDDQNV
jgi:hypothetical protein